jgi:hypothetical protein
MTFEWEREPRGNPGGPMAGARDGCVEMPTK